MGLITAEKGAGQRQGSETGLASGAAQADRRALADTGCRGTATPTGAHDGLKCKVPEGCSHIVETCNARRGALHLFL